MSTGKSTSAAAYTLKAYEDRVAAQVHEAKAKLELFAAKAKGVQADVATINGLKAAKQNIDRKLQDLKATSQTHLSRAKADIDADIATFKAAVEGLGAKHTGGSTKK